MNYVLSHAISNQSFSGISEEHLREGIHDPDNLHQLLTDNLAVYSYPPWDRQISVMAQKILADECSVFSGRELNAFARRAKDSLIAFDPVDRPKEAARLLIHSGLVGRVRPYSDDEPGRVFKDKRTNKYCKYYVTEFEYLVPGQVVVNDASLCAVHPILADHLGLKPREGDEGIVYPIPENIDLVDELTGV